MRAAAHTRRAAASFRSGTDRGEGRPLQKEAVLRPGQCRIGNWLPRGEYEPVRAFSGRMDELAIWKRALSQKELQIQVERGRPDFLWSANK